MTTRRKKLSNNKSGAIYTQDVACIATAGVEKAVKDATLSSEVFDCEHRGEKGETRTDTSSGDGIGGWKDSSGGSSTIKCITIVANKIHKIHYV